jgi:hypothetical protein
MGGEKRGKEKENRKVSLRKRKVAGSERGRRRGRMEN